MDLPSAVKPFAFQKLQDTEIRLVDIHALQKDSTRISCALIQGSLEDLSFEALSYVWEPVDETVEITLNGRPLNVTINLEAFLRKTAQDRARKDSDDTDATYIWIDALCIDQRNISERSAQVKMMGSIYSHATRVTVWLGSGGDGMKRAIHRIKESSRFTSQLGGAQAIMMPENRATLRARLQDTTKDENNERKEMFEFFKSPWWTRMWVLQEVALAKSVTFVSGDESISFEHVYNAFVQIYASMVEDPVSTLKSLGLSTEEEAALVRVGHVVNTRALFEHNFTDKNKSTRLQSLLRRTERAKATDLHDKIYGLLGMISDPGKDELSPRYDIIVERLYLKVVVWFLKQYGTLSIFGHCFSGYSRNLLSLPSSVPHWEPKEEMDEGPTPFHWEEYEDLGTTSILVPYKACGNLSLSSYSWSLNEEKGKLSLTGAHLGTLTFVSQPARVSFSQPQEESFALAKQWLALDEELGKHYGFTNESTNLALRRIMVGDFLNISIPSKNGVKKRQRNFMLMLPDDPVLDVGGTQWDYRDSFLPFMTMVDKRRIALSSEGWIGLVPETAVVGDRAVVLIGGPMLYVVRDVHEPGSESGSDGNVYSLVGEAYFHGFVDGKALDGRELETIVLALCVSWRNEL
ncbi:heterokaryon incompatibility protein-domain-containing protein [Cadophora sp. MPI-SDFR-AT-0126]|nr:heterokaryon incompatibility protein-domain-containing protein [Leotiomycetes sp. MPI-SDFR-AT-0126]